jgi:hypothetical protein
MLIDMSSPKWYLVSCAEQEDYFTSVYKIMYKCSQYIYLILAVLDVASQWQRPSLARQEVAPFTHDLT